MLPAPLPQHPHPPCGQRGSAPPALEQLQGQSLFCQRRFPPQSSVSALGPQPVAAFPKVSASAVFCLLPISVFCWCLCKDDQIVSPPLPPRGRRIPERSGRRDPPGAAASPRCCLCQSVSPQGGRAEDGAFSCHPTCRLIFVGETAWSAGVGAGGCWAVQVAFPAPAVEDGDAVI